MSDGFNVTVRFPTKKIANELKRLAREHDRSLNWMIVKACEEMIERATKEPTNA